jgi:hypothetical protein
MADEAKKLDAIEELPEPVRLWLKDRENGDTAPRTLEQIFVGSDYDGIRIDLKEKGMAAFRDADGADRFVAVNLGPDGRVMDVAAAIPRSAGKAYDFLNNLADFRDLLMIDKQTRKDAVALFHKIARADGTSNNAINKLAALMAPEGSFKVNSVKGQRGRSGDKVAVEAQAALNWWKDHLNANSTEGVITGDRGLTAFIMQGSRLQFIEGDHVARHLWADGVKIPNLSKTWSLPMNLQTFSTQHIEIPDGLEGTNTEIMYWVPPAKFINLLQNPQDPNLKKYLDKLVPSKVKNALIKDKRYFLEPDLLIHIKHRATQIDTYGVSLLEPTLADVRYKRALDALELTVITNLMARMVIIKVGSDNEKSVYHKQEVSSARLGLLQRMMRNVGPSATILWAGPDIDVVEVSAHDALLDIVPRMQFAERRQLMALGLPAYLMVGEGSDGKAAGLASALGVAALLGEVQQQYTQALRTLAERILLENGYEEIDVVWEWHNNILEDKQAAAELILKLFDRGVVTPETVLEETGFDFGAEETRQADAVAQGYKEKPFGAPLYLTETMANPAGLGGGDQNGGGQGRPTKKQNATPDPRAGKETKSQDPNK